MSLHFIEILPNIVLWNLKEVYRFGVTVLSGSGTTTLAIHVGW